MICCLSMALKCVPIKNFDISDEDKLLAKLDSPYLLTFIEAFREKDDCYYIVTEYCSVNNFNFLNH